MPESDPDGPSLDSPQYSRSTSPSHEGQSGPSLSRDQQAELRIRAAIDAALQEQAKRFEPALKAQEAANLAAFARADLAKREASHERAKAARRNLSRASADVNLRQRIQDTNDLYDKVADAYFYSNELVARETAWLEMKSVEQGGVVDEAFAPKVKSTLELALAHMALDLATLDVASDYSWSVANKYRLELLPHAMYPESGWTVESFRQRNSKALKAARELASEATRTNQGTTNPGRGGGRNGGGRGGRGGGQFASKAPNPNQQAQPALPAPPK